MGKLDRLIDEDSLVKRNFSTHRNQPFPCDRCVGPLKKLRDYDALFFSSSSAGAFKGNRQGFDKKEQVCANDSSSNLNTPYVTLRLTLEESPIRSRPLIRASFSLPSRSRDTPTDLTLRQQRLHTVFLMQHSREVYEDVYCCCCCCGCTRALSLAWLHICLHFRRPCRDK